MPPEQEAQLLKNCLSAQLPKRRRPSSGVKRWLALVLILLFAAAVYVGLYPWGFFMGGDFHPLGYWCGWGRLHSKTAGDYFLYVEVSPQTRRMETIIPHTFVKGNGHLCTPEGELFSLRLNGDMPPHIYLNTVGQPIRLGMSNWRDVLPIGQESHPSFSLWGRWGKGEIVADDRHTLSQAFLPDGTLRPNGSHALPSQIEDIQMTLREGTYSEFKAACAKSHR